MQEVEAGRKLQLEQIAYKKMMYHCMRYPSSKVYGILVGDSPHHITDAYPLFHTAIVNPSLTIAMNLIESNLADDVSVQGFYEFIEDGQPNLTRIIDSNPQLKKLHMLRVFHNGDGKLLCGMNGWEIQSPEFATVLKELKEGQHRFIVDMDAHLQDIALDFRNLYVK